MAVSGFIFNAETTPWPSQAERAVDAHVLVDPKAVGSLFIEERSLQYQDPDTKEMKVAKRYTVQMDTGKQLLVLHFETYGLLLQFIERIEIWGGPVPGAMAQGGVGGIFAG